MLSGGMVGRFCEPIQGKYTKVPKPTLAPKGLGLGFPLLPYFGAGNLTILRTLDGLTIILSRGPKCGLYLGSYLLRFSLTTSWLTI